MVAEVLELLTGLREAFDKQEAVCNSVRVELKTARDLLEAISIVPAGKDYISTRAKPCTCGHVPIIAKSQYDPGWIAQCKECSHRTVVAANPIIAIRYWNADNLTEESLLTRNKLTVENVDTDGCVNVLVAIKQQAVSDLMSCEKAGSLKSAAAKDAREWIKDPKVIADIESGERRRRDAANRKGAGDQSADGDPWDEEEFQGSPE